MNVLVKARPTQLTGYKAVLASLAGAAFTAICANIAFHLPGNPVPVTGQVFAVILCGMLLGGKLGALSQIQYIAAGLLGAPVFAGYKAGPLVIAGPTVGYLVGFVVAAYMVGRLMETCRHNTFAFACRTGLLGVAVIYVFGVAWLAIWAKSMFPGWAVWAFGAAPFIGLDAVKIVVASMICTERKKQ